MKVATYKLAFHKAFNVNYVLLSLARQKQYRNFRQTMKLSMSKQVKDLLDDKGFQKDIDGYIKKGEELIDINDLEKKILVEVNKNINPLTKYVGIDYITDYKKWAGTKGGILALIKIGFENANFKLTNPQIIKQLRYESAELVKGIDNTTRGWISRQLAVGRSKGMSYQEIADQLDKIVPQTYFNRSETIVRTETSRAMFKIERETAKYNGVQMKEWITANDGRVRDTHLQNQAEGWQPIDYVFSGTGESEPGQSEINCRCVLGYSASPFTQPNWTGE